MRSPDVNTLCEFVSRIAKSRSTISVLDQAVFSLTNFALNIYVARELGPSGYGLFALLYAFVFLANAVQLGAVAEPATVLWPRTPLIIGQMRTTLIVITGFLYIVLASCVAIACKLFIEIQFSAYLVGTLLFALLPLSYFWIFRQLCYAENRPNNALCLSIAYAIGIFTTITISQNLFKVSALNAILALAVGGATAVVAYLCMGSRAQWQRLPFHRLLVIARSLWAYSRWSAPSGILIWFSGTVFLVILSYFSLSEAGEFRAFSNLLIPVQQTMLGLSLVMLPNMARLNRDGNLNGIRRLLNRTLFLSALLSILYSLALAIFIEPAYNWIYKGQYGSLAGMYIFIALLPILGSTVTLYRVACRALGIPAAVFHAHTAAIIVSVAAALGLGWYETASGALMATIVQGVIVSLALIVRTGVVLAKTEDATAYWSGPHNEVAPRHRVALFGLPLSDNLGDGLIARCLRDGLGRGGFAVRLVDIAGRVDEFLPSELRRRSLIRLYFGMPAWLRKPLAAAALFLISVRRERQFGRLLRGADIVVVGGGNLFADHDLNFPLKLRSVFRAASKMKLPVLIAGVGVASSWSNLGQQVVRRSLDRVDLVYSSVRDRRSAAVWERLHFRGEPEVVRDFGLMASRSIPRLKQRGFGVGLCVMSPESLAFHGAVMSDKKLLQEFWSAAAKELLKAGLKPTFFNNGSAEDVAFMDVLRRNLASVQDIRFVQPSDVDELCNTIASLDGLLAFRMHAIIAAFSYGVPFVAIKWDEKLESFLESVNLSGNLFDVNDGPEMACTKLMESMMRGYKEESRLSIIRHTETQVELLCRRIEDRLRARLPLSRAPEAGVSRPESG